MGRNVLEARCGLQRRSSLASSFPYKTARTSHIFANSVSQHFDISSMAWLSPLRQRSSNVALSHSVLIVSPSIFRTTCLLPEPCILLYLFPATSMLSTFLPASSFIFPSSKFKKISSPISNTSPGLRRRNAPKSVETIKNSSAKYPNTQRNTRDITRNFLKESCLAPLPLVSFTREYKRISPAATAITNANHPS